MRALFALPALVVSATLISIAMQCSAQTTWVDLQPASTGGERAASPLKLSLSLVRPSTVSKEPAYRYHPQYGVLHLGDAVDNSLVVVLDSDAGVQRPYLYVDVNGNGDLTDDPPVPLAPVTEVSTNQYGEKSTRTHAGELSGSVVAPARYAIAGRGGTLDSTLQFTVTGSNVYVDRAYARTGRLVLEGRTYLMALVDQKVDGRFNQFKHGPSEPPAVSLLIDRNRNGVFDLPQESVDAGSSFVLRTARYKVISIDARGTHVVIERLTPSSGTDPSSLASGTKAIAFDSETADGGSVAFPADYKNKVVLLDFWATWCPPCREEIPNEVQVYRQYHDKGFEILGVSLDQQGMARDLGAFCQAHNMPWTEVYDGGYWQAALAVMYGIHAIPQAYLVDGNTGSILALGDALRGEGLGRSVASAVANLKKQ